MFILKAEIDTLQVFNAKLIFCAWEQRYLTGTATQYHYRERKCHAETVVKSFVQKTHVQIAAEKSVLRKPRLEDGVQLWSSSFKTKHRGRNKVMDNKTWPVRTESPELFNLAKRRHRDKILICESLLKKDTEGLFSVSTRDELTKKLHLGNTASVTSTAKWHTNISITYQSKNVFGCNLKCLEAWLLLKMSEKVFLLG